VGVRVLLVEAAAAGGAAVLTGAAQVVADGLWAVPADTMGATCRLQSL
jgi:hypothetical protein